VFALEPVEHGWVMRVYEHDTPDAVDLTALTPPLRMAPNPRDILGWHFRNADNTGPNRGEVNAPQEIRAFFISPGLAGTGGYRPPPDPAAPGLAAPDPETDGVGRLRIRDYGLADLAPGERARMVYLAFALVVIGAVFAFLQFTTFGMVVRAGMRDRETVGLLGIDIDRRFTIVFGLAAVVAGLAGVMYTPILPPDYHMGMDFLVLSFVVVVVGGMGSLGGAVAAGFLLGIVQSFASMNEVKEILPGIDQIIIYLIAVIILLVRPRGLMGRKGVMET